MLDGDVAALGADVATPRDRDRPEKLLPPSVERLK